MIEQVDIQRIRGIREASLSGLSPLTILVGPNGSGKSTVLDALLLAGAPSIGRAVGFVVLRREELVGGARWLFWKNAQHGVVVANLREHGLRRCALTFSDYVPDEHTQRLRQRSAPTPFRAVLYEVESAGRVMRGLTVFSDDNSSETNLLASGFKEGDTLRQSADAAQQLMSVPNVRLLEPQTALRALHDAYSDAVKRGHREELSGLLGSVLPAVRSIEVLTEESRPILHAVMAGHSVPVAVAGDGIRALVRIACELAAAPGETVLLEEPEVHQHPASLRQTAIAILAAVRRGVQIVLTTHSLDLIDLLLAEAHPGDVDRLSLYRLRLDADSGDLLSTRVAGTDVQFARSQIQDDLR